jgi:hypothetical protein
MRIENVIENVCRMHREKKTGEKRRGEPAPKERVEDKIEIKRLNQ